MAVVVSHSTPSDGTFSAAGATAWDANHSVTGLAAVASSGSGADLTDGSVTYAKIQNVSATSRILGRITAGAGSAEELTAANVKTILGLTSSDVGLGSVTNDAQTKAAIVPNTAPSAGQILVGNAGGTAYAPVSVSGDGTLSSAGALSVTKVNGSTLAAIATTGSGADLSAASVTYAKIQNVSATSRFLGRITAGAGSAEELTAANAKTILALTSSDVGLGNVTNNAQTQSAIVPNTAPSAGQMLVGNAGGTAYAPVSMSGDVTIGATGVTAIGSAKVTRTMLAATGANWQFLGTATGATTTVGPVIWTGTFKQLMIYYWIQGYNGGTPVGRLLLGSASISTTALTNSYSLSEGVTAPTTASGAGAVPGCPLAVTLSNIGRGGVAFVDGASGGVKTIIIEGRNGTPAVSTAPTLFRGASFFSDLGTNLALQRAQLTVYDTLTATAASAQTFTSGTYLAIWGRNTD